MNCDTNLFRNILFVNESLKQMNQCYLFSCMESFSAEVFTQVSVLCIYPLVFSATSINPVSLIHKRNESNESFVLSGNCTIFLLNHAYAK